jgi:hypothetical protein
MSYTKKQRQKLIGGGLQLSFFRTWFRQINIGCFLKFHLKVGVEESIVSAPLVSLQSKNTNNAKSEVKFIVFLPLIEILTKIINHTNKETDLKAPHPVIYGGVLNICQPNIWWQP